MAATQDKKKHHRFSNMFKKSKDEVEGESSGSDLKEKPSMATQNTVDSAYASSEPPSTTSEPNFVPMENNGQINNVDADRNLAVNKATGDVVDEDTGEVVSTVTTTTTTTTTTTLKRGGKDGNDMTIQVSTVPNGASAKPDTSEIVEAPGDSAIPSSSDTRDDGASGIQRQRSPIVPIRHPHRRSGDLSDSSNQEQRPGYNFSHPSRSNLRGSGEFLSSQNGQSTNPSNRSTLESLRGAARGHGGGEGTFENLRAAAVGLHGVGETLRGTLNHEVDSRFPRGHSDKASAANLKNQAVLDRGREEMNRISEARESWNTNGTGFVPPPQQQQEVGYHPGQDHVVSPITSPSQPHMQPGYQFSQGQKHSGYGSSDGHSEKKNKSRKLVKRRPA